jgi:type II secretory pathway component PulC
MKKILTKVLNFLEPTFEKIRRRLTNVSHKSLKKFKKSPLSTPQWEIEKFSRVIFSQDSWKRIHQGFLISLILSVSLTSAKMIGLFFKTPEKMTSTRPIKTHQSEEADWSSKLLVVKNKNLFQSFEVSSGPGVKGSKADLFKNIICIKAEQVTALPIKLLNTIVLQDPKKSLVSVSVRNEGELKNFRLGEKIEQLAEIGKIERLKIVIKNLETGECENVVNAALEEGIGRSLLEVLSPKNGLAYMKQFKMDGITHEGNKIKISKKLLMTKLSDMENILTQAQGIPIQAPDGTLAFKIVDIVPGGIFSFLGIENGDNITHINGNKITGLNEIMNLLGNIQNVQKLKLTLIKEDGSERGLEYQFDK